MVDARPSRALFLSRTGVDVFAARRQPMQVTDGGADPAAILPPHRKRPECSNLLHRLGTAGVLIPAVLAAFWLLPYTLMAWLLGLVVLLGAWEWSVLAGWPRPLHRAAYTLATGVAVLAASRLLAVAGADTAVWAVATIWWLCVLVAIVRFEVTGRGPQAGAAWFGVFGWLILIPPWMVLIRLDELMGPRAVLALFVLIWSADSAAYFGGRRFGRRRLAGRVSPGKTQEGLAAALLAAVAVAAAVSVASGFSARDAVSFGMLSVVTVLVSVVGDLAESLFKRRVGVKDSGTLLPGHGGVLDRVDSLTAAAPVFALGLRLLEISL